VALQATHTRAGAARSNDLFDPLHAHDFGANAPSLLEEKAVKTSLFLYSWVGFG